jgi:hypothetical protein
MRIAIAYVTADHDIGVKNAPMSIWATARPGHGLNRKTEIGAGFFAIAQNDRRLLVILNEA